MWNRPGIRPGEILLVAVAFLVIIFSQCPPEFHMHLIAAVAVIFILFGNKLPSLMRIIGGLFR